MKILVAATCGCGMSDLLTTFNALRTRTLDTAIRVRSKTLRKARGNLIRSVPPAVEDAGADPDRAGKRRQGLQSATPMWSMTKRSKQRRQSRRFPMNRSMNREAGRTMKLNARNREGRAVVAEDVAADGPASQALRHLDKNGHRIPCRRAARAGSPPNRRLNPLTMLTRMMTTSKTKGK